MDERISRAFWNLIGQTALSPGQMRELLAKARTNRYWKRLNPTMSLTTVMKVDGLTSRRRGAGRRNALSEFEHEGYFALPKAIAPAAVQRVRSAIETIRNNGWPPVFAMVYDELWNMIRTPELTRTLTGVLGPDYYQIPRMWCHYVIPAPGHSGWAPHVDGRGVDGPGTAKRVSIWLALSDATLENGCIYLVPRSPSPKAVENAFGRRRRFSRADVGRLLQNARALPAKAGTVLCWDFGTVHWGAASQFAAAPRISAAFEFIAGDVEPTPEELPLLNAHSSIPDFEQRLRMIGTAILAYRKFEPRMHRYAELAQRLRAL